ncbi:MAG: hypothetical protein RIR26_1219, partial [Pseudomonadota bacterium]
MAGRRGWLSGLACVTFIYIPNESATSRRIRIPKVVLYSALTAVCILVGLLAALSANLAKMANLQGDYEKLRIENTAIRSEAAALVAKLQEVKSNLAQVDHISNQVRQEAASLDPRNEKKKKGVFAGALNAKSPRASETSRTESLTSNDARNALIATDSTNNDLDKKIELPV